MSLQFLVNHPVIDAELSRLVALYEQRYAPHILAYYLEGSYADGSALSTSDIDVVLISEPGTTIALTLWTQQFPTAPVSFDLTCTDTTTLAHGVPPQLKHGGKLLYGQDICQRYPVISLPQWTHDRMHAAYWLLNSVYGRPRPVSLPIAYPDPADEFYGYVNRWMPLPNGTLARSTRNLLRTSGWIATALLARRAGQMVGRKSDCFHGYRQWGQDPQGADLLELLYEVCRGRWNYQLPDVSTDRSLLRALCQSVREWEQDFILEYRTFLLEEFAKAPQGFLHDALRVQAQWPLQDEQVQSCRELAAQRLTEYS